MGTPTEFWGSAAAYILGASVKNVPPEAGEVPPSLLAVLQKAIAPLELESASVAFVPTQPDRGKQKALRLSVSNSGQGSELLKELLSSLLVGGVQYDTSENGGITTITIR